MKKLIVVILSVMFLTLGGGTNGFATEPEERPPTVPQDTVTEVGTTEPKPGELLVIQKRQEEIYRKDKLQESLSAFMVISEDNKKVQLHYYGTISSQTAVSLQNDLFVLKNRTKLRNIDLYIYCFGGDMFAGFAIIESIKAAQKDGFKFTAYATGAVGSMAIPLYAICDKPRIAYHSTIFMVHPSTLGFGKNMMTGADIQSQTDLYNLSQDLYVSTMADHTNLTKEEWLKKIEKDTWFSAQQAKEWGLVDEIK